MDTHTLTAISPLDGRYHAKMGSLNDIFSEFGLIKYRILVEVRWLEMLAEHANLDEVPPLSSSAKKILKDLVESFSMQDALRVKHIEAGINHDVKAVEYFIKERIHGNKELEKISEFIHFGCTSEDINNLAYALMLQTAHKQCVLPALDQLVALLRRAAHDYANIPMLARTHGQAATPTTVGKELANTIARLLRQIEQLNSVHLMGKLNGATGNYNALMIAYPDIDWQIISKNLVAQLGLNWNPYTTQIEPHDSLAEYFAVLLRINNILIDFNRDVWGYISIGYFKQKSFANEVGSSTMPHKINPIDFENAEGNLGLANALLEFFIAKLPISRWQRDLSDSTVLRNVGVAIGYALLAYQSTSKGVEKLEPNLACLDADLHHHWEVLAEAIQTVMRKHHIKPVDAAILREFIQTLALPDKIKESLLALKPSDYVGCAADLAKRI
jgi:adenylosuccinate lyase